METPNENIIFTFILERGGTPSKLVFKSKQELKVFLQLYLADSDELISGTMEDSIGDGEKSNKSECDFDWLLKCYAVCYDEKHVYCSEDIFVFDDPKTRMVFYRELIILLHGYLIRCNNTQIRSSLDGFDYSDDRCGKCNSFARRDVIVHEKSKQAIEYSNKCSGEPSYAWLVVSKCDDDIPSFSSEL